MILIDARKRGTEKRLFQAYTTGVSAKKCAIATVAHTIQSFLKEDDYDV